MHHHHQQHTVEYFSASYDNSPNHLPQSHNPGSSYLPSKVPSKVPSKFPINRPPASSGVSLSKPTFFKPIVVEYKPTTLNHIFKVTTKKPMKIPFRPPIVQDKIPIVQDKYPTKPGCKCSKNAKNFKFSVIFLITWFDFRMWVETRRFQSGHGERVGASEYYWRAGSPAKRVSVGGQVGHQR
jgi:hypothetical protein